MAARPLARVALNIAVDGLLAALAVALSTRAAFSADLPRRATGEAP